MTWVNANLGRLWDLSVQHLWLSIVPVLVGLLIAIPIGWLAHRWKVGGSVLLSVAGLLYTLPSLALFAILPGLLGTSFLDPLNVAIVMTLYAVALLVRVVADAFSQVSEVVLDAASATGYSRVQRFFAVELPLAGPVVLAGVRVVSVGTVSLVTVGSLIGVSNLGSLFTEGFQRDFPTEIVTGIVLVIALALILDGLWVLLGRVLLPWAWVRG
ncbi:ABC transporter permease [Nocardioides sp.]|uniref:ABC transporter permease n=1 Tax=Nocardioides sp. TaxID=35761 RepID=UPI00262E0730|nr:ABC transporter permease [Nocardioides sp.]